MTDLTAKDLHDLYKPRLTALGAWPECFKYMADRGSFGPTEYDARMDLYTPHAACILRCAAEDALVTEAIVKLMDCGDIAEGRMAVVLAGRIPEPIFEGRSIHHALCAALDVLIAEKSK